MTRARRRVHPVIAGLAVLAVGREASAQSRTELEERVRVELKMPATCAERERFFAHLRDKLGTGWEAAPDELARTIDVSVAAEGGRYVARIELTDARGRRVIRAVAGAECANVVDGIALITVLAIQAQLDELLDRSEPVEPGPAETETGPPASAPSPRPTPARSQVRRPNAEGSARGALSFRLGGRAGVHQGIGPDLAPIFGAFAGAAWESLALGLAFDAAGTGEVRVNDVPAELELWAARLEGCARFRPTTADLTVEPCGFFQAGRLTAQGIRAVPVVAQPSRGSTAWLVPGVLVAVRAKAGPFFVGLEASAGISLDREHFYIEAADGDRRTVFQVPAITSGSALCAGVAF